DRGGRTERLADTQLRRTAGCPRVARRRRAPAKRERRWGLARARVSPARRPGGLRPAGYPGAPPASPFANYLVLARGCGCRPLVPRPDCHWSARRCRGWSMSRRREDCGLAPVDRLPQPPASAADRTGNSLGWPNARANRPATTRFAWQFRLLPGVP